MRGGVRRRVEENVFLFEPFNLLVLQYVTTKKKKKIGFSPPQYTYQDWPHCLGQRSVDFVLLCVRVEFQRFNPG